LVSRFTTHLWRSRQCGFGKRVDIQINGITESPEIDPHVYSGIEFLEKVLSQLNGGKENLKIKNKKTQMVLEQLNIHMGKN
jgi:hypothetical protein